MQGSITLVLRNNDVLVDEQDDGVSTFIGFSFW